MDKIVKYPKTKKSLEKAMKVIQRELEDGRLKVEMLDSLVGLVERLGKDGRN